MNYDAKGIADIKSGKLIFFLIPSDRKMRSFPVPLKR